MLTLGGSSLIVFEIEKCILVGFTHLVEKRIGHFFDTRGKIQIFSTVKRGYAKKILNRQPFFPITFYNVHNELHNDENILNHKNFIH